MNGTTKSAAWGIIMEDYIFQGDIENSKRILYTPSSFARNTLIHLQETGCLQSIKPHTNKRSNLESYLFFIVESGSGTLNYGGNQYSLHSGDCVFIDCRLEYSHSTSNDLWKLKWVHFNGPNMQQIYIKYKERGGTPCFRPKDIARYDTILSEINASADSSSYVKDMLIFQKLTCLLTYLMEDSWMTARNKWLLAHPESTEAAQGAHVGLSGENIDIKDYI